MKKEKLIENLRKNKFSENIVKAFEKVPREKFVPKHWEEHAYEDTALSIGEGQTISQPYTIAFMLSLLELDKLEEKSSVLEVGSGSGYVLALLRELTKGEVYGIERIKALFKRSKDTLKNENIKIFCKDGTKGLKKFSPYDRILVSASGKEIPKALIEQLKIGGIIVIPIGSSIFQIKKTTSGFIKREFSGFVFVPLITGNDKEQKNKFILI
ncbi:MAG: protein-L-isoaspartate(D-aspartate) O-methyltransferase [Candidatus Pacearchaeota archaeon]